MNNFEWPKMLFFLGRFPLNYKRKILQFFVFFFIENCFNFMSLNVLWHGNLSISMAENWIVNTEHRTHCKQSSIRHLEYGFNDWMRLLYWSGIYGPLLIKKYHSCHTSLRSHKFSAICVYLACFFLLPW